MANYKRRKPRRQVKCAICTPHRLGNNRNDKKARDRRESPFAELIRATAPTVVWGEAKRR